MSATGAGYDLSAVTYSPDGRVFQVEYASKAVEKSGTVIGVRCVDGVVLAAEKLIVGRMLVRKTNKRLYTIDNHCGMALAGLVADARQIVNRARSEASDYRGFYGGSIPGNVLNDRLSGFVHTTTLYWYARPFGASVLLASYEPQNGPCLFNIEPSGVSYKYYGAVIGKHKRGAKSELEKLNYETLTCRQAVKELARIIYKLHDDIKDKDFELEMSWVCDETDKKHVLVPEELRSEAAREAAEIKKKEEMDDSDDD